MRPNSPETRTQGGRKTDRCRRLAYTYPRVPEIGTRPALMAWLKRATFTPFVVYRVLLGAALLALSYGA